MLQLLLIAELLDGDWRNPLVLRSRPINFLVDAESA